MTSVKNLSNRELRTFRQKMICVYDNSHARKVKGEVSIVLSIIEEEMFTRGIETDEEFAGSVFTSYQLINQLKAALKQSYYNIFSKRSKAAEVRFKV